jgi:hypothetical protein
VERSCTQALVVIVVARTEYPSALVRYFYCGSNAAQVDEYLTIARKLWDEEARKPTTP